MHLLEIKGTKCLIPKARDPHHPVICIMSYRLVLSCVISFYIFVACLIMYNPVLPFNLYYLCTTFFKIPLYYIELSFFIFLMRLLY